MFILLNITQLSANEDIKTSSCSSKDILEDLKNVFLCQSTPSLLACSAFAGAITGRITASAVKSKLTKKNQRKLSKITNQLVSDQMKADKEKMIGLNSEVKSSKEKIIDIDQKISTLDKNAKELGKLRESIPYYNGGEIRGPQVLAEINREQKKLDEIVKKFLETTDLDLRAQPVSLEKEQKKLDKIVAKFIETTDLDLRSKPLTYEIEEARESIKYHKDEKKKAYNKLINSFQAMDKDLGKNFQTELSQISKNTTREVKASDKLKSFLESNRPAKHYFQEFSREHRAHVRFEVDLKDLVQEDIYDNAIKMDPSALKVKDRLETLKSLEYHKNKKMWAHKRLINDFEAMGKGMDKNLQAELSQISKSTTREVKVSDKLKSFLASNPQAKSSFQDFAKEHRAHVRFEVDLKDLVQEDIYDKAVKVAPSAKESYLKIQKLRRADRARGHLWRQYDLQAKESTKEIKKLEIERGKVNDLLDKRNLSLKEIESKLKNKNNYVKKAKIKAEKKLLSDFNSKKWAKNLTKISKLGLGKVSYLAGGGVGVVLGLASEVLLGNNLACAGVVDKYVNLDDNCQNSYQINKNVIDFLGLNKTEQDKIFSKYPEVCNFYKNLHREFTTHKKINKISCYQRHGVHEAEVYVTDKAKNNYIVRVLYTDRPLFAIQQVDLLSNGNPAKKEILGRQSTIKFDNSNRFTKEIKRDGRKYVEHDKVFDPTDPNVWTTELKTFTGEYIHCCENVDSGDECLGVKVEKRQDHLPESSKDSKILIK
jgi:hypothetical protein